MKLTKPEHIEASQVISRVRAKGLEMTEAFEMPVQSMFHMPGHGTVFQGKIVCGTIRVGDRIMVTSPEKSVSVKVSGLEETGTKRFLSSAREGNDIAILVRNFNLDLVSDGWKRSEEGIPVPVALKLCKDSRPWWKLWL